MEELVDVRSMTTGRPRHAEPPQFGPEKRVLKRWGCHHGKIRPRTHALPVTGLRKGEMPFCLTWSRSSGDLLVQRREKEAHLGGVSGSYITPESFSSRSAQMMPR